MAEGSPILSEIAFLREQIEKKKQEAGSFSERFPDQSYAKEALSEYIAPQAAQTPQPAPTFPVMKASEEKRLLQVLAPKSTDEQVTILAQVMVDKGIKQAIETAAKSENKALEDDFHRFLVQYLLSNQVSMNVNEKMWKALQMKLYEVIVPEVSERSDGSKVKEVMQLMQRFYASMQTIAIGKDAKEAYFSIEVALPEGSQEISFYCAVHKDVADLFEKTIIGVFPALKVEECPNDFNIFTPLGSVSATYAKPTVSAAFPLKTYEDIEGDPITLLLSAFSKVKKDGEGVALQLLVKPQDETSTKRFTGYLNSLRKGDTWKQVRDSESVVKDLLSTFGSLLDGPKDTKDEGKPRKLEDEQATKDVEKKLSSTLMATNLRVVVSAETHDRAEILLKEVESAFLQLSTPTGGALLFEKQEGGKLNDLIHDFEYRLFNDDQLYPFNVAELSTFMHFPMYVSDVGQLRSVRASVAQAPLGLGTEGVLLGVNRYKHLETPIHFGPEDRMRHLYVIGQTGTGKTTILKNMIVQDIKNGDGCCFIDPHGSDIEDILANVPRERMDDVIYFDPSYSARPMGLNMLEYDESKPEQKIFVVNELLSIFKKLFAQSSPESMGPAFEQYFRNTAMLVMEHPQSGMTLLDLLRVLSDKDYRDYKLSKCKNPLIKQFWVNAEATTGDQGLQNYVPYISNKFDVFLSNDVMRPIIAQEKSTFDIRKIMDERKIFLVNLSKGRLGDINAQLIGLILVGKFLQAALGRVDTNVRPDFFLYIDEFQNVTTPSISAILSEARKYRLSLNLAHQFIAQLPEDIKGAVFGNVGSKAFFRVGPDDATYLESQVKPVFNAADLMKVENYNAYLTFLAKGTPQKPFSLAAMPPSKGDRSIIETLKEKSYLRYGRPRDEVEAEIMRKYDA